MSRDWDEARVPRGGFALGYVQDTGRLEGT